MLPSKHRRRSLFLLASVLAPALVLTILALGNVARDLRGLEERLRSEVAGALEAAEASFSLTLGQISSREGAWHFRCDRNGEILEPRIPDRREEMISPSPAPEFFELERAVLEFERRGDVQAALTAVNIFVKASDSATDLPRVLTVKAALESKLGDRAALEQTVGVLRSGHSKARDDRGMLRVHGAMGLLSRLPPKPEGSLLELYAALIDDELSTLDHAVRAQKKRVQEELGALPLEGAELERRNRLDLEDRSRERMRRVLGARERFREWLEGGAPGGVWAIDSSGSPGDDRLLVSIEARGDEFHGAAEFHREVAAHAMASLPSLRVGGVPLRVEMIRRQGAELPSDRALRGPLSGFSLRADGDALKLAKKEARKSAFWAGGLTLAGFLAVLAGAGLSLRALRREWRAVEERDDFVALVTHELKAPLASIRLLAEILERGGVEDAKVRDFAGRTIGEADRLTKLVESILEMARLEQSGELRDTASLISPSRIAERSASIFEPIVARCGARFDCKIADHLPGVSGNEDALCGALLNLLDNALKYSDGIPEISLAVESASRSEVSFRVRDRGRGVPLEERERIFEPFARIGDTLTKDRPGAGLGLALVKRIVLAHRGSITVDSRDGGGSEFTITLPAEPGS